MIEQVSRLSLFPLNSVIGPTGHLAIGGCDTVDLALTYGTPLYVFDEATLRDKMAEFKNEFCRRYPDVRVLYACKAFANKALLRLVMTERVGLDVVSGGEIEIARSVGFPMNTVSFPGNNKSPEELKLALDCGIGRIVVDNFDELEMLDDITRAAGKRQDVLIRITPGVDPHTHRYESTGSVDSKFGFPMTHAEKAITDALAKPGLNVVGLHFHLGSQITETAPYEIAISIVLDFASGMVEKHGLKINELSVGGGYPVKYLSDEPVPALSIFAEAISGAVKRECEKQGLPLPRLVVEPGRSLVARAGVALYTVGVKKEIPDIRTYVSVDGGMADNIRPALYQSKMEAVVANRMNDPAEGTYTIAGKFCESGDILIEDIELPIPHAGDILAVPGCGAYNIPQSCNYNAFLRPAVVMVKDGKANLIRRRETLEDITACDVWDDSMGRD